MKKIALLLFTTSMIAYCNTIDIATGTKVFKNSATKTSGDFKKIGTTIKNSGGKLILAYSTTKINREHFQTKATLPTLKVKKINLKYIKGLNKQLKLNGSFIKIDDNLAPTDNGKVYGLGAKYNLSESSNVSFDHYLSDYKDFNVNQSDITYNKKHKINDIKLNTSLAIRYINIDGNKYKTYNFTKKNYFSQEINTAMVYKGYITKAGILFNKRLFTVLNGGQAVQHHALEHDNGHYLAISKKLNNWNIMLKYRYEKGEELPENKTGVSHKTTAIAVKYRF